MVKPATLSDHEARISRVVAHLEAHLDEPLAVPELARVGAYSEFHFQRVFRAVLGESVKAHVRRLRLERAARTLRDGQGKVVDVALGAGFESHEAFTRAFTAHFGVAPAVYRAAHRPLPPVEPPGWLAPRLVELPPRRVLTARHLGPYDAVGATWQRLFQAVGAAGLGGRVDTLGLCWDDPETTDPARFRYDACVVVDGERQVAGLEPRVLDGGRFALGHHEGSYAELPRSYGALTRWVLEQGLELAVEASMERYLVAPPAPEAALRTELLMRLN